MINLSKRYETRDGCDVELFTIKEGQEYPVIGAFHGGFDEWLSASWTKDGTFDTDEADKNPLDLIEVKPERVVEIK